MIEKRWLVEDCMELILPNTTRIIIIHALGIPLFINQHIGMTDGLNTAQVPMGPMSLE